MVKKKKINKKNSASIMTFLRAAGMRDGRTLRYERVYNNIPCARTLQTDF